MAEPGRDSLDWLRDARRCPGRRRGRLRRARRPAPPGAPGALLPHARIGRRRRRRPAETLLAAWRGLAGFEGRSSLRAWLYRIATNCCLRIAERQKPRILSWDHGPSRSPDDDLGTPAPGPWLAPWTDPDAAYERKETIELAYVAALQHLPPNQRAVLVLRELLEFSAPEVAELLETSLPSVNSALQRARQAVATRVPARERYADARLAEVEGSVLADFVDAFERRDVVALVRLLSEEVRFTMPPLPARFDRREDVSGFFERRVFATPWRARPLEGNGQPALACYQEIDGLFRLSALDVLTVDHGRVTWIASFLDPEVLARTGLPTEL